MRSVTAFSRTYAKHAQSEGSSILVSVRDNIRVIAQCRDHRYASIMANAALGLATAFCKKEREAQPRPDLASFLQARR